jgi:ABC-type antimicrobial peptide transport system permease subunit
MEWDDNSFQLFVQRAESSDMNVVHKKIARVVYDNIPENGKAYDTEVFLHPLRDWHLRSSWENGVQTAGDIQYVWWFGIIGAFVLILACVNYMNLSTAQSIKRAKEVGVLKSIGMNRGQLIMQFLTESILTVFIAFLMSSMMTYFVLPYFNSLTNKEIVMPLTSAYFWVSGAGFAIVIGLLSGSYPALYLSSFNATQVLKGTSQNTLSAALFR